MFHSFLCRVKQKFHLNSSCAERASRYYGIKYIPITIVLYNKPVSVKLEFLEKQMKLAPLKTPRHVK